jgi:hypothetical protein
MSLEERQILVLLSQTVIGLITWFSDRAYRWYGAQTLTRLVLWLFPITALCLYELTLVLGGFAELGLAMNAIGLVIALSPRAVIRITGGPRFLVALGNHVQRIGDGLNELLAARATDERHRIAKDLERNLEFLGRFERPDTSEYIRLLRIQADEALSGEAEDPSTARRLYELERSVRTELDKAGVGPWSWYWVANAEARARGNAEVHADKQ